MGTLPQRTSRHQGAEPGLQITLPLILCIHERHACAEHIAEIDAIVLLLIALGRLTRQPTEEGTEQIRSPSLLCGWLASAKQGLYQHHRVIGGHRLLTLKLLGGLRQPLGVHLPRSALGML